MLTCTIVSHPGLVSYDIALAEQYRRLATLLSGESGDCLMLLEHPPTITLGRGSRASDLLRPEEDLRRSGITVVEADRGGEITYHGPGQLVVYPIISLDRLGRDLHAYLRNLEEAIIRTLAHFDIAGERIAGLTGVWANGRKIAAIGIKSRRWVTMHGFALNIDDDLTPFRRDFVPCGITDRDVTSMAEELGPRTGVTRAEVEPLFTREFCALFGFDPVMEEPGGR